MMANYLVLADIAEFPAECWAYADELAGRSVVVKTSRPLPVECIVRGYLSGSGWNEYRKSGTVCGIRLPAGLVESSRLPDQIFTPSTKAEVGHDENITFEQAVSIVGREIAEKIRDASLKLYRHACEIAEPKGIIIADTKMEFGLIVGALILIDELLTPDSSRF